MAMAMAMAMVVLRPSPFLGHLDFGFGNILCRKDFHIPNHTSRIKALFWEPKKSADPPEMYLSLDSFTLTNFNAKEVVDTGKAVNISVSVVSSILEVPSSGFLSSLEESGSARKETGWMPRHIIAQDEDKNILGVIPLYLKSHSYGEYVFDHSWADAYYRYGSRYYPKLQCCVPFTPVSGPRILVRKTSYKDQVFDVLISAMKDLAIKLQVSSLHITFSSEHEWNVLKDKGFLQRTGMQYHWKNRNYTNFDDFLMDIKQSKRKNIRQERKKVPAQNLTMKRLRGHEIKAKHWDTFYTFYRNTTDNKLSA